MHDAPSGIDLHEYQHLLHIKLCAKRKRKGLKFNGLIMHKDKLIMQTKYLGAF